MNYPPKHHQDNDQLHMIEVIKTYPLATIISVKDDMPFITHLPLVYKDGKLSGHIDKFNPHTELLKDNRKLTIIFSGPQCYISPSIYTTTQLPTWNYIMVHLKGTVKEINDVEEVKKSLIAMTEFLEAPKHNYVLTLENSRMEKFVNYIKGFEIDITQWEGKFKLSQDKKPRDIENARAELIRANQENIKTFMNNIF